MSLIPNFPPLEVDVRGVREKKITMEQKLQAAKFRVSLGLRQASISGSEGGGEAWHASEGFCGIQQHP